MANIEVSQEQAQIESDIKYGRLTMALGLAAVIGSFAIPSHRQTLNELRAGLDIAGLAVMVKGYAQTLIASGQSDRFEDI